MDDICHLNLTTYDVITAPSLEIFLGMIASCWTNIYCYRKSYTVHDSDLIIFIYVCLKEKVSPAQLGKSDSPSSKVD